MENNITNTFNSNSIELNIKKKKSSKVTKANKPRLTEFEKNQKHLDFKQHLIENTQKRVGAVVIFPTLNNMEGIVLGVTQNNEDKHDFKYLVLNTDRDVLTIDITNRFHNEKVFNSNMSVAIYLWKHQREAIINIVNDYVTSNNVTLLSKLEMPKATKRWNKRRDEEGEENS